MAPVNLLVKSMTKRLKKKNPMIISLDAKKTFDENSTSDPDRNS